MGRGGMGIVWRATDLSLERPVALKLIAPELAQDAQALPSSLSQGAAAGGARPPARDPDPRGGRARGAALPCDAFAARSQAASGSRLRAATASRLTAGRSLGCGNSSPSMTTPSGVRRSPSSQSLAIGSPVSPARSVGPSKPSRLPRTGPPITAPAGRSAIARRARSPPFVGRTEGRWAEVFSSGPASGRTISALI